MSPAEGSDYKKYKATAQVATKGEAFFESLVADYSIPHRIVGLKDLGIDFICEWVSGDRPAGILYGVQVRTFSAKSARPELVEKNYHYNLLDRYDVKYSALLTIDEKTQSYWKAFGMPFYLFAVCTGTDGVQMDCYYKRYTPILTGSERGEGLPYYSYFFKVNKGNSFLAYGSGKEGTHGFARDLYVDCMHWRYYEGSIASLDQEAFGLRQFGKEGVFADLFQRYRERICRTYSDAKPFLDRFCTQASNNTAK